MAQKKIGQRQVRKPNPDDGGDDLSFEQSLQKLDEIVTQLEDGQLGLDQSLSQYEQGIQTLKQCYDKLARAERKIELLADVDSQGRVRSQPFSDAELSLEQKQAARSRRRSNSGEGGAKMDDRGSLF